MHLLVTGGAGFIGSHFVLRHAELFPEDTITVLDKLTYAGNKQFLEPVLDRIAFQKGDIADVALLTQIADREGIDTIVNFAAETHVDRSIESSLPFLHANVIGVQSLIELCRLRPHVRLYHISTDEVYGDIEDGERPRTVEDPLLPSSPYAASKASGDLLIMAAMRTYGIKACVSRCTNNFGPRQAEEKFIPTVIRSALADQPVPLYGKGQNKRDWLYVTDHTDAIETILHTDWAFADDKMHSGHFFNISADSERANIDVAKAILKILGKPESLLSFVTDRPGHDWRYAVDSSSTKTLGWKPVVSFEEGLEKTVAWYRQRSGR